MLASSKRWLTELDEIVEIEVVKILQGQTALREDPC